MKIIFLHLETHVLETYIYESPVAIKKVWFYNPLYAFLSLKLYKDAAKEVWRASLLSSFSVVSSHPNELLYLLWITRLHSWTLSYVCWLHTPTGLFMFCFCFVSSTWLSPMSSSSSASCFLLSLASANSSTFSPVFDVCACCYPRAQSVDHDKNKVNRNETKYLKQSKTIVNKTKSGSKNSIKLKPCLKAVGTTNWHSSKNINRLSL